MGSHSNLTESKMQALNWTVIVFTCSLNAVNSKTCIIRVVIRHKPLHQIVHLICLVLVHYLKDAQLKHTLSSFAKLRRPQILSSLRLCVWKPRQAANSQIRLVKVGQIRPLVVKHWRWSQCSLIPGFLHSFTMIYSRHPLNCHSV